MENLPFEAKNFIKASDLKKAERLGLAKTMQKGDVLIYTISSGSGRTLGGFDQFYDYQGNQLVEMNTHIKKPNLYKIR